MVSKKCYVQKTAETYMVVPLFALSVTENLCSPLPR